MGYELGIKSAPSAGLMVDGLGLTGLGPLGLPVGGPMSERPHAPCLSVMVFSSPSISSPACLSAAPPFPALFPPRLHLPPFLLRPLLSTSPSLRRAPAPVPGAPARPALAPGPSPPLAPSPGHSHSPCAAWRRGAEHSATAPAPQR